MSGVVSYAEFGIPDKELYSKYLTAKCCAVVSQLAHDVGVDNVGEWERVHGGVAGWAGRAWTVRHADVGGESCSTDGEGRGYCGSKRTGDGECDGVGSGVRLVGAGVKGGREHCCDATGGGSSCDAGSGRPVVEAVAGHSTPVRGPNFLRNQKWKAERKAKKLRRQEEAKAGRRGFLSEFLTDKQREELALERVKVLTLDNKKRIMVAERRIAEERLISERGAVLQRVDNWVAQVKKGAVGSISTGSMGLPRGSDTTRSSGKRSKWSGTGASGASWRSGSAMVEEAVHLKVVAEVAELRGKLAAAERRAKYENLKRSMPFLTVALAKEYADLEAEENFCGASGYEEAGYDFY